jgi:hypothetical protein
MGSHFASFLWECRANPNERWLADMSAFHRPLMHAIPRWPLTHGKRGHRMNTIHSITASRILLIGAIGFLASAAWAQDTPTPPTADQAKKEMQSNKKDPLAIQSSGPEEWSMLKGHEKGYVSKSDALPNSWLEHNFQKCDADQDGKVTEAEYTKCQKAM